MWRNVDIMSYGVMLFINVNVVYHCSLSYTPTLEAVYFSKVLVATHTITALRPRRHPSSNNVYI
jgi:hypothetical protein